VILDNPPRAHKIESGAAQSASRCALCRRGDRPVRLGLMSRSSKLASVLGVLVGTVILATVASSCGGSGSSNKAATRTTPTTPTTTIQQRGAAVYAATCAGCHGSDGGGGIGPQLSGGHAVTRFPNADDQVGFVTKTHAPLVPAVGQLSSDDVRAVVEYTRGL